jgi:putative pyruvate formate lyase activating enzyme
VNRLADERGFCRTGRRAAISSYGAHFGEEPPLIGQHGSGTIFISRCTLACEYCQNADISQFSTGEEVSSKELADVMIRLQQQGCHNINIVTPTHIVPQLIHGVKIAAGRGLHIPLVYNCGGYEALPTLRLLDGIIDIYMPDAKYGDDTVASDLSHVSRYVSIMKDALGEMHRQVGDLVIENGIAIRGLLIRHLVLPDNLAGSDVILPWIAREISSSSYVNIMAQYHPAGSLTTRPPPRILKKYPGLLRPIIRAEYQAAIRCGQAAGLHRGFSSGR